MSAVTKSTVIMEGPPVMTKGPPELSERQSNNAKELLFHPFQHCASPSAEIAD